MRKRKLFFPARDLWCNLEDGNFLFSAQRDVNLWCSLLSNTIIDSLNECWWALSRELSLLKKCSRCCRLLPHDIERKLSCKESVLQLSIISVSCFACARNSNWICHSWRGFLPTGFFLDSKLHANGVVAGVVDDKACKLFASNIWNFIEVANDSARARHQVHLQQAIWIWEFPLVIYLKPSNMFRAW